jgi:hypothetical protein
MTDESESTVSPRFGTSAYKRSTNFTRKASERQKQRSASLSSSEPQSPTEERATVLTTTEPLTNAPKPPLNDALAKLEKTMLVVDTNDETKRNVSRYLSEERSPLPSSSSTAVGVAGSNGRDGNPPVGRSNRGSAFRTNGSTTTKVPLATDDDVDAMMQLTPTTPHMEPMSPILPPSQALLDDDANDDSGADNHHALSPDQLREWMSPGESLLPDKPSIVASSGDAFATPQPPKRRIKQSHKAMKAVNVDEYDFSDSQASPNSNSSPSSSSSSHDSPPTTAVSSPVVNTVPSFSEAYTYDTIGATAAKAVPLQDDERTVQTSNVVADASLTAKEDATKEADVTTTATAEPVFLLPINTSMTSSDEDDEYFYNDYVLEQSREQAMELQSHVALSTTAGLAQAATTVSAPDTESEPAESFLPTVDAPPSDDALSAAAPDSMPRATPSWAIPQLPAYGTGKASKPLFGGEMYQTMAELAPILSTVESKRQTWFANELAANQREWDVYCTWLRTAREEVSQVATMIADCYEALVGYATALDDLAHDTYVDEQGQVIPKKKDTPKFLNRSTGEKTETTQEPVAKPLLDPMTDAFAAVKAELDTYLVSLQMNLEDVTVLQKEMIAKAQSLEDKGLALGTGAIQQAEVNIQVSFQALIVAAADWSLDPPDDGNEIPESKDMRAVLAPTAERGELGKDRWMLEARYRSAAKLGLLAWQEHRRDYQNLYEEIIRLDAERKGRLQEILLSFLPKRNKLLSSVHGALSKGTESLEASKRSMRRENEAIEQALAEIARRTTLDLLNDNNTESSHRPGSDTAPSTQSISDDNVWQSIYTKDRLVVALKVSKGIWKVGVCVITLDNHLHLFVTDEDATVSVVWPTSWDVVAQRVKASVPEYSVKLADFDIIVGPPSAETADIDIEFSRRGRSKIFRKREDNFSLKVPRTALAWTERLQSMTNESVGLSDVLLPPPPPIRPVVVVNPQDLTEI